MIDDNALIDLGFVGYNYTWNNRKNGKENIQKRLDRGNADWITTFPNATITYLLALTSDHKPILIQTNPAESNLPKPFMF